jgi:hypothetical protein
LEFIKEKALKAISRLLAAKPEGEQALVHCRNIMFCDFLALTLAVFWPFHLQH